VFDENSAFSSRKAAKLAKKSNELNLSKNLGVFAPLRETFLVPVYPPLAGLFGLEGVKTNGQTGK